MNGKTGWALCAHPVSLIWSGKRDLNPRFNSLITQQFLLLIVPRRTALCTNSSRLATPSRYFLRHRLCPARRRRRSADPSRIAKDQLARVAGLDPMRTTRSMKRVKGTAPTTQPVDQQRISWGQLPKKASILDSKIQVGQRDGPDKSTQSRRRLPIANVPGPMRVKERAHRLAAGTTAEHAARTASSVPRARSDGAADRSSAWA